MQAVPEEHEATVAPPEERIEQVKQLVATHKAAGELDRVIELQVELMALTHMTHGGSSMHMARAYWSLADAYLRKQLADQAIGHCKKAYQIVKNLRASDDEARKFEPTVQLTLGMCCTVLRKFKEGGRWLHRALELLDDIYGEDHPGTVLVYLGLSTMCQAQNKWEAARDHLIRAW